MAATTPTEMTGLQMMKALIASGVQPPMGRTLKFSLVEVEEGRAVFEGEPGPEVYNPIGTVHGGYAATLLDSACACAVQSKLAADQTLSTLELKVAFHKALTAKAGKVLAEARVLSIGQQVAFCEATLRGHSGRLFASATSTLLIMKR
ncbi:MAG: thioesterase [Phenylobacterium sp.]|nr:thioesterase [Phenylobacterium sp.]